MRILVTGAGGMLGSEVVPALREQGHEVDPTDLVLGPRLAVGLLDVREEQEIADAMTGCRPEIVLHLAALTSLEECELDSDNAWHTNALGTKNVALACKQAGIPMAYISSAGVFNGRKRSAYTEFDKPDPVNVYGASKAIGEKYVRQWVPEHFIIRAGWMMGGGPTKDHKFVSHIMKQIEAGAPLIRAVNDKIGTPTYAKDFAECFAELIGSNRYGTYHMASPGSCSRFDVAKAIVDIRGRQDIVVMPVDSTYFAENFFATRPPSEAMRNMVLELEGRNTMRPWREALAEYLQEWPA